MSDKLLSTRDVAHYLGITEEALRKLVDQGVIPAYRLGGTILRFKKHQIDEIKAHGIPQAAKVEPGPKPSARDERLEQFKDFIYFNDFYLISAAIIIVLLVIVFFY